MGRFFFGTPFKYLNGLIFFDVPFKYLNGALFFSCNIVLTTTFRPRYFDLRFRGRLSSLKESRVKQRGLAGLDSDASLSYHFIY